MIAWVAVFAICLIVEGATVALTSIWFAGGAFAAFIVCVLGFELKMQLLAFAIVSFLLLLLVRPVASSLLKHDRIPTNADRLIGREAVVKVTIDSLAGTGSAVLDDQTWLARAASKGEIFPAGTIVKVVSISGAKLIVESAGQH